MTLKTSEKLAVTILGLSIVQVVAATVALYYGLTLYFLVEVEVLSYASINYQLLPILIIGLATLAASNRFDFIRISLINSNSIKFNPSTTEFFFEVSRGSKRKLRTVHKIRL